MLASGGLGIGMGITDTLRQLPPGTLIPAAELAAMLGAEEDAAVSEPSPPAEPIELTWRERLWLVPAETRMATADVLEALGHSRTWLYKHMAEDRGPHRLPHRKLDGELVFTAGELRAWLRSAEEVVVAGPMESTPSERGLHAV